MTPAPAADVPTRPRLVELVLRLGSAALGAMWLTGAATKVFEPAGAFEFATRLTGGGPAGKAAITGTAAAEALLGTLLVAGAMRGYAASFAVLAAATWALVHVRTTFGGQVKCGCLALVADSTVDEAIVRNAVAMAAAALLFGLDLVTRRRAARDAAAVPGPARA